MNFENIQFQTRAGHRGKTLGMYVNGNNWVPKAQFRKMWDRAQEMIPRLDWTYPKTTKAFFERNHWKALKLGHKLALGRCLRYFADHELLPIRCINPEKKGTKRYAPIAQQLPYSAN
jgi:hypothetical protein